MKTTNPADQLAEVRAPADPPREESMARPRIFISYSHDSEEHADNVLRLSQRLRADGFNSNLDRYVKGTPQQGWPRWMLDELDAADFVLVVCTDIYYRRFRGHADAEEDEGKGVDWEGAIITQEVYQTRSKTLRFVPVMFPGGERSPIPEPLRPYSYYLLDQDGYNRLKDYLVGQAGIEPSELGELKPSPRRSVPPLTFRDRDESHVSPTDQSSKHTALQHLDALLDTELDHAHKQLDKARVELARQTLKPGKFASSWHQIERKRIYEEGVRNRQQVFFDIIRRCSTLLRDVEPADLLSELLVRAHQRLGEYMSEQEARSEAKGIRGGGLPKLDLNGGRVLRAVEAELTIFCREIRSVDSAAEKHISQVSTVDYEVEGSAPRRSEEKDEFDRIRRRFEAEWAAQRGRRFRNYNEAQRILGGLLEGLIGFRANREMEEGSVVLSKLEEAVGRVADLRDIPVTHDTGEEFWEEGDSIIAVLRQISKEL